MVEPTPSVLAGGNHFGNHVGIVPIVPGTIGNYSENHLDQVEMVPDAGSQRGGVGGNHLAGCVACGAPGYCYLCPDCHAGEGVVL